MKIFRDMAAYVDSDGVLIQDDASRGNKGESDAELEAALADAFGKGPIAAAMANEAIRTQWIKLKTDATNAYVAELAKTIRTYRPTVKIARNIYGETLTDPESRQRFTRNLDFLLRNFDYTVIMPPETEKNPDMSKIRNWVKEMVSQVKNCQGADKAIFRVQAFDWEKHRWIEERVLREERSAILALGAKHIAYYPDGVVEDKPGRDGIASIISGQEFIGGIRDKSLTAKK